MDFFGIGAAMRGMAEMYFRGSRQTGRTTALVEHVQEGDAVIFKCRDHAEQFKRDMRQRFGKEINVTCMVWRDGALPEALHGLRPRRLYFDHPVVEHFYREALANVDFEITGMQKAWSTEPDLKQSKRARLEESRFIC